MLVGPGCLATVAGLLMVLSGAGCQGNAHEPVNRLMVFRDVPKGLDIGQPQHLIVRTSYPGSVEFLESNEFRIEVNVSAPSINELSRFHYNYTDFHGSVLLQLFDAEAIDAAAGSMVIQYILLMIGGVATMSFCGSLVFVCWWNSCKRSDTLHTDKVPCPDSSQAPLLEASRQTTSSNQTQNSNNKVKSKPSGQQKSLQHQMATDESCMSSEDDLVNDERTGTTRIRRTVDGNGTGSIKRGASGANNVHRRGPGGGGADQRTAMEMDALGTMLHGSAKLGDGCMSRRDSCSPARSDCPSDERSVSQASGSVTGTVASCVRMDGRMDCTVDGGGSCNTLSGGRRSAQYIQLNDKFSTISGGSAVARSKRDNGIGVGPETTIPDVVRTRQHNAAPPPPPPPPPVEFSDAEYSSINRNMTGGKVVQLVSDHMSPPHAHPPSVASTTSSTSSSMGCGSGGSGSGSGRHSGGEQRSVTFSPSAKQPADIGVSGNYDTFGRPRVRHDNTLTVEPRFGSVTAGGAPGRRGVGGGGGDMSNDRAVGVRFHDGPSNGRTSPGGDRRSTMSDGSGRLIDEAYGTLGSSSCSTLGSGGTASSSGSSGSVVTVIASGNPSAIAGFMNGVSDVGGSLTRRQHTGPGAKQQISETGGTLPGIRKGAGGGPRVHKYLQTSLLSCLAAVCLLGGASVNSQKLEPPTTVHVRVYAPTSFHRGRPEVFARQNDQVSVVSGLQTSGVLVDKFEVLEPRISDLRNDKCRGVPCESCDAGSGTCICNEGYRLVGTRCEDVNECEQMNSVCHERAKCQNVPGSFRCICMDGYYGNGFSCKACSTPCDDGTYEVISCSSSHPKLCRECSKSCTDGYYISATCRPTNDTVCKPCKKKCERMDYELTPCVGALDRQCKEIDSLLDPVLSANMIMEDRRKVKQVMSFVVLQDSSKTSPLTHNLPLKRGSGFTVHVTIKEANLAPIVRAVNHSESNDNEGFFEEIKITQEYCAYPIPEKYQLSLVLHQGVTTKAQFYNCGAAGGGATRKKRNVGSMSSAASPLDDDKRCVLETGYYLNPREPCETYSKFGRLPPLNGEGWSVLCVAPGRLSDAFGVSSELTDMTTMFVDRTVKCAEQRTNCDACTVNCARTMQSYKGGNRCNITADDADNGESPRLAYCLSCCNKAECSKLCEVYHNRECQQLRCITGNLAEFVLSPVFSHKSTVFACHIEPVPRYKIYDIEYSVAYKGVTVNDRRLKAQRLYDARSGHPEKAVDTHNFLKIYFGSKITTKPDLIEGESSKKSFIAGYYQAKGPELGTVEINAKSAFVRPKIPFGVSSKTWKRESCDSDILTRLVNASSGSPPDSEPFKSETQLEVQYVSRGTYRLFNKTLDQMPFIYFELPREVSILRASGIYDATTVRDDSTLRADLIRTNASAWVLHVNGEMLRCPGAFSIVVRDPGYSNQPLFDFDVGVACPVTFSIDFTIPTDGPDNYDKTLLVDLTDSYRTIKMTIFRPAPNMTTAAHEFFNSNKSYDGPVTYTNAGEIRINIFSPFVGLTGCIVGFLIVLLFIGFITDTDKMGSKTETRIGLQHMCFVVCYVTFRVVYSVAVTFTVLVLLLRHFNRDSATTLMQFSTYVETAGNSQRLDIEHIQAYVSEELQRQNAIANQTKQQCELKLIQLQNQLEDAKQQIRVDNHEDRLVSQVALQYTKLMVLNLTNSINKFKQEFTTYAKKALDRLTRSIVQTSSAIQSSKWLAGAKVIYDVVRTKRQAQGLETKPFMEWAGLHQEVDRLVADLSLKDFPMPNLTEFLNIDLPKPVKKPSPIPRASDVVLPRNQWYYQYDKKPVAAPPPINEPSSAAGSSSSAGVKEGGSRTGGIVSGDIVGATTLLAVLIAIDFLWFVHRMARTYTTSRMILYGCPVYIACKRANGGGPENKMCFLRCLDYLKNLNLRVMKTEFVPKLVATVTVLCALYVALAASDKLVTVKSLASIGYFDALVAPVETSYRLARTRVKMNAQRINKFELPFYEELVNVRAKRYQLLLDMYAEVQRSAAVVHDSEYCAWQRLLKPDEPCNCTSVHVGKLTFDGCELPPVLPQPYLRKEFSLHRDRLGSTIVPYVNAARTIVTDTSHLVFVFVTLLVIIDALGAVIWIYLKKFNVLKLKPLYEIEQMPAVSESNHR